MWELFLTLTDKLLREMQDWEKELNYRKKKNNVKRNDQVSIDFCSYVIFSKLKISFIANVNREVFVLMGD